MSTVRIIMAVMLVLAWVITAQAQPGGWVNFEFAPGGFSVWMPTKPMERTRTITLMAEGEMFAQVERREFTASKSGTIFRVAYFNLNAKLATRATLNEILDMVRNAKLAISKGKLLNEQVMDLASNPGREILVAMPNGARLRSRLLAASFRVYDLMAAMSPNAGDAAQAQAQAFLDSFQLLD
jgi:hypothetical protein